MTLTLTAALLATLCGRAAPGDEKVTPDLALVPADAVGFVSARVADLAADARMKAFAPGLVDGLSVGPFSALGLKDAEIERVTVAARRFAPPAAPVLVIRMAAPLDRAALLKRFDRTEVTAVHGKSIVVGHRGWHTLSLWTPDGRTLVVGEGAAEGLAAYLGALGGGKAHAFADELKLAAGRHVLVIAARPEMAWRVFDAERRAVLAGKKGGELKLRTLAEVEGDDTEEMIPRATLAPYLAFLRAKRLTLTADGGAAQTLRLRADFADEDAAKDAEVVSRMGLYALREVVPRMTLKEADIDRKGRSAVALVERFQADVRAAEAKAVGKVLTASLRVTLDQAMLNDFIAEVVPIKTEANKLKMFGVGFHAYHDTHGHFPAAICDKGGKPLLSWRVALLPFVEQGELYKQFRLDEPWDSPHNRKLLTKVPRIYRPVVASPEVDPDATKTAYQVFTGPNTLFPRYDAKPTMRNVTDGSSNTFLVAEASKPVPWTKPEDIAVDAKMFPKLGGQFPAFFHALFVDGSARRVKRGVGDTTLRAFVDPSDGVEIHPDKLKP